ncbi:MAG: alpha/beta fold hydrolase [Actinomycetota bacterium]
MSAVPVLADCEAFSHDAGPGTRSGVLVLHGFTGNPSSMRLQAHALADAGHHVEQPRLPGHGTSLDDMLATTWADWSGEAAVAYDRLAARADRIVVMGLSMGGTLTLWTALERVGDSRLRGLICVNPAAAHEAEEMRAGLTALLDDGTTVVPAIGSDIADPEQTEISYDGTPVAPLVSLIDAKAAIADRYGELSVPLLLFTSYDDHVVPPDQSRHLAATHGAGDGELVDHVWLERSYHVATQDHDRDLITERSLDFVSRVTA